MINMYEVSETNKMIESENLDVRTITLGISLLDCVDSDLDLSLIHICKLKSAELLLKEDGSVQMIRRAETPKDYFATFDCFEVGKKLCK